MAKKNPTEIAIVYQKGVLVLFKKNNHFQFLGCAELSGIDYIPYWGSRASPTRSASTCVYSPMLCGKRGH
jgi:hypothetical protein